MKPGDFSIATCHEPSVRVYYNGYAVIRLEENGLHRTEGQPHEFPVNGKGQIKVVRKYNYQYFHEYGWCDKSNWSNLALNGVVVELRGVKLFLRQASDGVALVGVVPGAATYTLLVIDSSGLHMAGGCQGLNNRIALDKYYKVLVWRD